MERKKIATQVLRYAGLILAETEGHPLRHAGAKASEKLYVDGNGKRVRLRTSNDRTLTVTASSPNPDTADLDIEGCDSLLLVMPTEHGGLTAIEAYWVPYDIADQAIRTAHRTWLDTKPRTSEHNQTFSIWFDQGVAESGMFRDKWVEYRLANTLRIGTSPPATATSEGHR